jgi:hypothetical protein
MLSFETFSKGLIVLLVTEKLVFPSLYHSCNRTTRTIARTRSSQMEDGCVRGLLGSDGARRLFLQQAEWGSSRRIGSVGSTDPSNSMATRSPKWRINWVSLQDGAISTSMTMDAMVCFDRPVPAILPDGNRVWTFPVNPVKRQSTSERRIAAELFRPWPSHWTSFGWRRFVVPTVAISVCSRNNKAWTTQREEWSLYYITHGQFTRNTTETVALHHYYISVESPIALLNISYNVLVVSYCGYS